MSAFNSYESTSLDLDLYFLLNNRPIHIATMGLGIPKELNDRDAIYAGINHVLQIKAEHGYEINDIVIDKIKQQDYKYLQLLDEKEVRKIITDLPNYDVLQQHDNPTIMYCWSFVDKACKGFYSFNTIRDEEIGTLSHQLIAMPEVEFTDKENVLISIQRELDMDSLFGGKTILML